MSEILEQIQKNFVLITLVIASIVLRFFFNNKEEAKQVPAPAAEKPKRINEKVKLESEKVVDTLKCPDIETMEACKAGKVVMCRCWKSEKFPYCDGAHNKHNQETGDNVGPLIVDTNK
jgi:CDGSH-type Zn-finger protein